MNESPLNSVLTSLLAESYKANDYLNAIKQNTNLLVQNQKDGKGRGLSTSGGSSGSVDGGDSSSNSGSGGNGGFGGAGGAGGSTNVNIDNRQYNLYQKTAAKRRKRIKKQSEESTGVSLEDAGISANSSPTDNFTKQLTKLSNAIKPSKPQMISSPMTSGNTALAMSRQLAPNTQPTLVLQDDGTYRMMQPNAVPKVKPQTVPQARPTVNKQASNIVYNINGGSGGGGGGGGDGGDIGTSGKLKGSKKLNAIKDTWGNLVKAAKIATSVIFPGEGFVGGNMEAWRKQIANGADTIKDPAIALLSIPTMALGGIFKGIA